MIRRNGARPTHGAAIRGRFNNDDFGSDGYDEGCVLRDGALMEGATQARLVNGT